MIDPNVAGLLLLGLSLVVTMINTVIIATTRAAVSELKAELVLKLATKESVDRLDGRLRRIETERSRSTYGHPHALES